MECFVFGQNGIIATIDDYVWVDVIRDEVVLLESPDFGSPVLVVGGGLLTELCGFFLSCLGIILQVG